MKISFKNAVALSLIPQIVIVKWLGKHSEFVENYYSTGFYPFISGVFRILFGWIPFSIGDLIYFALIILALTYLFRNRKSIWKNKLSFARNV
ncbi:DUF3810 family protein, partial [Maribacter arcticus]